MATSRIEWTDQTWNPVTGCTRVSSGCDHCYAALLTRRLDAMGHTKYSGLINIGKKHFNGRIKLHPEALPIPSSRSTPSMYFVNSMSDLFHPGVPPQFILAVFAEMVRADHHIYQVLTKRPERMRSIMPAIWEALDTEPLAHIWLGTSVESIAVEHRVDQLIQTDCATRFLSCEPLLGPLGLPNLAGIDWLIVGGESGPGARPFDIRWAADILEKCDKADVACFVKQLGARPYMTDPRGRGNRIYLDLESRKGGNPDEWPSELRVRRFPFRGAA